MSMSVMFSFLHFQSCRHFSENLVCFWCLSEFVFPPSFFRWCCRYFVLLGGAAFSPRSVRGAAFLFLLLVVALSFPSPCEVCCFPSSSFWVVLLPPSFVLACPSPPPIRQRDTLSDMFTKFIACNSKKRKSQQNSSQGTARRRAGGELRKGEFYHRGPRTAQRKLSPPQ